MTDDDITRCPTGSFSAALADASHKRVTGFRVTIYGIQLIVHPVIESLWPEPHEALGPGEEPVKAVLDDPAPRYTVSDPVSGRAVMGIAAPTPAKACDIARLGLAAAAERQYSSVARLIQRSRQQARRRVALCP
jgi:hypothetical protein